MNNKCLILVPTKGRPQNMQKFTLPLLDKIGLDYKLIIEGNELDSYLAQGVNIDNVVVLQEYNKGICYSLKAGATYALENNYNLVFKIDDDIKGFGGEISEDIQKLIDIIDDDIKAVAFPYKFEFYSIDKKRLFSHYNKRTQTCYIIDANYFLGEQYDSLEDFYKFYKIINDNKKTIFCCKYAIDCVPVGTNAGGFQSFDRRKLHYTDAIKMKTVDPSVKIIVKEDRNWVYECKFTDKKYRSIAIK
jgi:hypothetical protein